MGEQRPRAWFLLLRGLSIPAWAARGMSIAAVPGVSVGARHPLPDRPPSPACLSLEFWGPVSLPWGAQHPRRTPRCSEQQRILHPCALTRGTTRGLGTPPVSPEPPTQPVRLDAGPRCRYRQ